MEDDAVSPIFFDEPETAKPETVRQKFPDAYKDTDFTGITHKKEIKVILKSPHIKSDNTHKSKRRGITTIKKIQQKPHANYKVLNPYTF